MVAALHPIQRDGGEGFFYAPSFFSDSSVSSDVPDWSRSSSDLIQPDHAASRFIRKVKSRKIP
jgi:hypothetical protein